MGDIPIINPMQVMTPMSEMALQSAQAQLAGAQSGLVGQQTQSAALANQATAYAQQQLKYQFARTLAFQDAFRAYSQNPSTEGFVQLAGQFPDKIAELRDVHDQQDAITKRQSLTTSSSMLARANAGDPVGAARLYEPQRTADIAAGRHDEDSEQIYQDLMSGDPQRINAAKAVLAIHAATAIPDAKDAPAMLEAMGMSQKPIPMKPGDTNYNQVTGSSVHAPALLTTATQKDALGNETPITVNQETGGQRGFAAPGALPTPGLVVNGQAAPIAQGTGNGPAPTAPAPGTAPQSTQASGMLGVIKHIESGGRGDYAPNGKPLTSSAGAKYAMQVLPSTASSPGFGIAPAASDTPDEYNRVGQQLFQAHLDHFGDPLKAAAAYQSGRGGVNKAIAAATKAGNPNDWVKYLGPQGRAYVNKFGVQLAQSGADGTQVASNVPLDASAAVAVGSPGTAPGASPQTANGPQGDPYSSPASTVNNSFVNAKDAPKDFGWNADHSGLVPLKGGEADPNSYPPGMIDDAARTMMITGQMPSIGMGGAKMKTAIMGARSQIMKSLGITAEQLPAIQARYSADNAALKSQTQLAAGLDANEGTLRANLQQVLDRYKEVDGLTSFPTLNHAVLWAKRNAGDGAVKALDNSVKTAAAEYARYVSTASGNGNTATTDAARDSAEHTLSAQDSPDQITQGIAQLLRDVSNRRDSVHAGIQQLSSRLESYLKPGGGAVPATGHAGPVQVQSIQQAQKLAPGTKFVTPDGRLMVRH